MSVDFTVDGVDSDLDDPSTFLNLSNANAADLLRWLGLGDELCGEVAAGELAARCRRRLWDEPRNHDPERPIEELHGPGPRVITAARDAGYLRRRTEQLLALALRAKPGGLVRWS